jgi:hypothetical protein
LGFVNIICYAMMVTSLHDAPGRGRARGIALAILLTLLVSIPASAQFTRKVLIEEFTSATCTPCVQATPVLNDIQNTYAGKVTIVRYHVNLPVAGDPWYVPSFIDPVKSRYGVSGTNGPPKAFVDGQYPVSPTDKAAVKDLVDQELASTATSPVKVDVTQTIEDGQVKAHVVVTAGPDGAPDGYTLRVVLLEAHIHVDTLLIAAYNHEKDFYDVPRAVLTQVNDGTPISLSANQAKSFDFSVPVGNGWQTDQLFTVAFAQDAFGAGPVAQMGNSPRPAASGVAYEPASFTGYSLLQNMPNPASTSTSIAYTVGNAENVTITLFNSTGDQVASFDQGMNEPGEHRAVLDLSGLPAGVYSYTVQAGAWRATKMLTVVR